MNRPPSIGSCPRFLRRKDLGPTERTLPDGAALRRWCWIAMAMAVGSVRLVGSEISAPTPLTKAQPRTSASAPMIIRIKAGVKRPFTDTEGNVWLPDQGFIGGVIADRDVLTPVANTTTPALYRSERYSVTGFSRPLPNGKYQVRLHFSEMYERINGPHQRIFSINVEGHPYLDFDIWAAAGGARRAYVVSTDVEINDGKLDITFTPLLQYTTINAIEIIPESAIVRPK